MAFGRALQSVNILRNKDEDLKRGVNWYPKGWNNEKMFKFAERNLIEAQKYLKSLSENSPCFAFCVIPY